MSSREQQGAAGATGGSCCWSWRELLELKLESAPPKAMTTPAAKPIPVDLPAEPIMQG